MAQGIDGVHFCRAQGGVETENDADDNGDAKSQGDGPGNDFRGHVLHQLGEVVHGFWDGSQQKSTQPFHHRWAGEADQDSDDAADD